ncbi:hypothetical protein [Halobacteriovorax sp. RZ-2]|uniref:hypothetical protein n=1 Tax=unclassified Halobacteriovorax TaxID=2639665 RepID=UPI003720C323
MFKVKWTEYISFFVILVIGIYSLYISRTDLAYFDKVLSAQNGLLEWFTFVGLCLISFGYFYRRRVLAKFRDSKFLLMLVIQGVFYVICALEEVSWGQRIFDWNSPEMFRDINSVLLETNFQNWLIARGVSHESWNLFLRVILFIYLFAVPISYLKVEKAKQFIDKFALPVPKATHIISFMILLVITLFIPSDNKVQFAEFCLTWVLTALTLEPFNRSMFSRRSLVR